MLNQLSYQGWEKVQLVSPELGGKVRLVFKLNLSSHMLYTYMCLIVLTSALN